MTRCAHPKLAVVDGYSECVVCGFTPGIDYEYDGDPGVVEQYMPIEEYQALVRESHVSRSDA